MVEWVVIVYDKPGTDRLQFREQHLAGIPPTIENGKVTNVGAIFKGLDENGKPKGFLGSSLNVVADTKEEVIEFLKTDTYYKQGIWDLQSALIYPYGCASRVSKK